MSVPLFLLLTILLCLCIVGAHVLLMMYDQPGALRITLRSWKRNRKRTKPRCYRRALKRSSQSRSRSMHHQSSSRLVARDNWRGKRIGEASHPGPHDLDNPGPAVSHFDDPEADNDWPDEGLDDVPYSDGPPEEHNGWDAYGYEREPYSDSEASTAEPPWRRRWMQGRQCRPALEHRPH